MSRARTLARERAVQALYQWLMAGQSVTDIEQQFLAEQDMQGVDITYFSELLHGVPGRFGTLEGYIEPCLDRPLAQVDPVERAVLLVGAYEMAERQDIPYRVVINEAVEQAKLFGAEQGYRYVNGVLDKVARQLRAVEFKDRKR